MQLRALDSRIEKMYRGDLAWAIVALVVLWCTILFVFFEVATSTATSGVIIVLAIFAGLVLLFNTASILALLKHYAKDKAHLYGLDIHYLDEMRRPAR